VERRVHGVAAVDGRGTATNPALVDRVEVHERRAGPALSTRSDGTRANWNEPIVRRTSQLAQPSATTGPCSPATRHAGAATLAREERRVVQGCAFAVFFVIGGSLARLRGSLILVDAILTPTREPSLISSQGPGHPEDQPDADCGSSHVAIEKMRMSPAMARPLSRQAGGKAEMWANVGA